MNIRRFVFIVTLCAGYFSYRIGSGLDVASMTRLPAPSMPSAPKHDPFNPSPFNPVVSPESDFMWENMIRALEENVARYNGDVGVYFKDMQTGRVWEYNADELFPSASLIKLPIMVSVFDKIKRGELDLNTQLVLRRRERCGGSGSLKWSRDGTSLSVRELLDKMITESDNTATKMLISRVGIYSLQQQFAGLGLAYTQIHPEGMSLTSGRVAYENYTTAREMSYLLDKIYRGEAVDKFSSEVMVEILKRNRSTSRLAKALPPGWELGHKTGLLRRSCHDVGIIFSPKGDYLMAVLTGKVANYKSAKNFISKLARITFTYYGGDNSVLAQGRGDGGRI